MRSADDDEGGSVEDDAAVVVDEDEDEDDAPRSATPHRRRGSTLAARLEHAPAVVAAGRTLEAQVTALLAAVGVQDG